MNQIEFTNQAAKQLKKLDKSTQRTVAQALGTLMADDLFPTLQIKQLKSPLHSYRLRVGSYRILFEKHNHIITIHSIGHRRDVYR